MASKRRFMDPTAEGPNPKHLTLSIDDVAIERGNEIKSEDNFEDVPISSVGSYKSVNVDDIVEVKDEPVEVKYEPKMDRNEPEWEIFRDEKPVMCEIPVEIGEVDPLKPLNLNAEAKDEPMEDEVKTEIDGENSASEVISSSPAAEEIRREAHADIARLRSETVSRKTPLQEPTHFTEIKIKASDHRKSSDLQNFLSILSQQSTITIPKSPQTPPKKLLEGPSERGRGRPPGSKNRHPWHQEEDSVLAPEPSTHQNTNFEIENPKQDSKIEDLTETQADCTKTQSDEEAHQSSKTATHADKPDDSESSISVQLLVENHLLLHEQTMEQANSIIRAGRRTPLMGIPRNSYHGFWVTAKDYQLIPWLTGLEIRQKYYCWPCLLFTKERWSVPGGMTQPEFWAAIKDHNQSLLHKAAFKNLKIRESELNESKNQCPNPNHQIVKANRAFLELLIRILCSKKSKLHNTDSNFDGFEELIKVAISHEPELQQSLGKPPSEDGLVDFVSRHASKLLSSVESKITASISEEISRSQYVSIIYEDTASMVDRSSQVAVIIRLLTKDGDVCERFVKMVKIGSSRNAYDMLEMHLTVIEELGIREKFVGFTFNGTVLAPTSTEEFINIVSNTSPKAKFFHHPDHNFKELLLQSLSHLEECQPFLEVISEMVTFLTTNSGAIPTLVTFIKHNVPNCQRLGDARSFTTDIISTIRFYYCLIIEFFGKVSEKFWNDEVAKQAPIFMKFLQEPSNRFLIAVIAHILDTVDDLSKAMEKDYNAVEWASQAQKVLNRLKELYQKGGSHYVFLACKMQNSNKDKEIDEDIRKGFLETFKNIIETSSICVFLRAKKTNTFYLNSAHCKASDIIQDEENWNRYGLRFESTEEFQYQMSYNQVINVTFNKKSIPEIAKAVAHMQISDLTLGHLKSSKFLVWQDFIRFCAIAISPTKSTTSAPSNVLKLKYYLNGKQEINATEVLMFLEKGILRSQLKNTEFIEELITQYAKKNEEYNFLYDSPVECKPEID